MPSLSDIKKTVKTTKIDLSEFVQNAFVVMREPPVEAQLDIIKSLKGKTDENEVLEISREWLKKNIDDLLVDHNIEGGNKKELCRTLLNENMNIFTKIVVDYMGFFTSSQKKENKSEVSPMTTSTEK